MKKLLTLEEAAQMALGIYLFSQLTYAWWWFPALILVPDFSMIAYTINSKVGAWTYNFFHHKALGVVTLLVGYYLQNETIALMGIILFSHSALDRVFGYGLKYETAFKDTHLGTIGK